MYIVIECFGGASNAAIVTNEDGTNKVFDTITEATKEADLCQFGKVLYIG